MKVHDVMTAGCKCLGQDEPVANAAVAMAEGGVGSQLIENDAKLVGMLTDRDIVVRGLAKRRDPDRTKVGELMSPNVYYCFDDG